MKPSSILALACALGFGVGCGSSVSDERLFETQSAIESAETVGAEETPSASLHLQLAREQHAEAQRLIDDGETDRAERMLKRAELDAKLAIALTQMEEERNQANQVYDRIHRLQQEQNM